MKGRWAVQEGLSTASLQTQLGAGGALDPQNHPPRLAAVLQHGLPGAALCACTPPGMLCPSRSPRSHGEKHVV